MPWNNMGDRGISYKKRLTLHPQGSQECLGIAWNIVESQIKINALARYPQGSQECLGIAWHIVEYHIKINSLGARKGLKNALE